MKFKTSFGQQIEASETPEGLVTRGQFSFNTDGSIAKEYWSQDGKQHRDDGPAVIWYRDGQVFIGDTRTFEELEREGSVEYSVWYQDALKHRDDGPAAFVYYGDGSIYSEYWFRDDKKHRDDGPAFIEYSEGRAPGDTRTFEELEKDGVVRRANWYRDGKRVKRFT